MRQRADDDVEHVGDLGRVADDEIVRLAGVNVVPLGQELRDLVLGLRHERAACGPSTRIASTLSNSEPCSRLRTVV